ncbi:MAG: hypothetical protein HY927_01940 [Elusimicrobia bacterium]|nr:hypothetical protein [Elusimicrobiota bacterium]
MELYGRFIVALAFGLVGLGLVLQVLLDRVFNEWDAVADAQAGIKRFMKGHVLTHQKTEDLLLDIEKERPKELSTRLVDMRRKELREIDIVEHKLHQPVQASAVKNTATAARNTLYDEEWS